MFNPLNSPRQEATPHVVQSTGTASVPDAASQTASVPVQAHRPSHEVPLVHLRRHPSHPDLHSIAQPKQLPENARATVSSSSPIPSFSASGNSSTKQDQMYRTLREPQMVPARAHVSRSETISFAVEYCLPDLSLAQHRKLIELCKHHGVELEDADGMKDRLQQILFPEKRKKQHLVNPLNVPRYQQAFDAAATTLSDAQCRAIEKWTDPDNSYTGDLNEALSLFAATGEMKAILDPEDESRTLLIHEEAEKLKASLALLPSCDTLTLRIAHVTEPAHRGVYPEKIAPGMLVSTYPRFMSASSKVISNDDLMDAFDGKPEEVALLSEFHGFSGKPLGEFNPVNDVEEEILFNPESVFVLAATAKAVPDSDRHTTRVAALYIEVGNHDATRVRNLHTGEYPRFIPGTQS